MRFIEYFIGFVIGTICIFFITKGLTQLIVTLLIGGIIWSSLEIGYKIRKEESAE